MSNSFFKMFSSSNGESSTDINEWVEAELEMYNEHPKSSQESDKKDHSNETKATDVKSSVPGDVSKESITKITFTERPETTKSNNENKPTNNDKTIHDDKPTNKANPTNETKPTGEAQPINETRTTEEAKPEPASANEQLAQNHHDNLPNANREPLPRKGDTKMQKPRQEPRAEERTRRPRKTEAGATPVRAQQTEAKAILGPKTHFRGEITGQEDVIIQGSFEGSINLENNRLFIGEHGTFIGDVYAKSINVSGHVEGELYGQESVTIKASSKIIGNVKAARVSLEDGAKFKGSIEMDFTDEPTTRKEPKPTKEPVIIPEVTDQHDLQEMLEKIDRIEKNRQQLAELESGPENSQ